MDWVYEQAIGFLSNFFALMGNMGVELFELEWVSAIVLFFCSVIECRRFNAFWRNGSRLYAVESMQRGKMHLIECSGFYAAWPKESRWNAVDFMHCD